MSEFEARVKESEKRLDRRRAELERQLSSISNRRIPGRTTDPELEIAELEARQRLLELEVEHRQILSTELAISKLTHKPSMRDGRDGAGGVGVSGLTVTERAALMGVLRKGKGRVAPKTVAEALQRGMSPEDFDNPTTRQDVDSVIDEIMALRGKSEKEDVGVSRDLVDFSASDGALARPASSQRQTLNVMARAGRHGAQVAAAATANKELVDLVRTLAGEHWPEALNTGPGRILVELTLPSLLIQLLNSYPGRIPEEQLVAKGCELAVEAVARDGIEPLFRMLVPMTRQLAQAGSVAMRSQMDNVRSVGRIEDHGELEHEVVHERAAEEVAR